MSTEPLRQQTPTHFDGPIFQGGAIKRRRTRQPARPGKRTEYLKTYRATHRKEKQAWSKEYYAKNREAILAQQKAYRASPEGKARMRAYDRSPAVKARKKAYAQSPEGRARQKARNHSPKLLARIERNKLFIRMVLAIGCAFCDPKAPTGTPLRFHHFEPALKRANVSTLVYAGTPIERIIEEIKCCIVLCKHHHRQLHNAICALAKSYAR